MESTLSGDGFILPIDSWTFSAMAAGPESPLPYTWVAGLGFAPSGLSRPLLDDLLVGQAASVQILRRAARPEPLLAEQGRLAGVGIEIGSHGGITVTLHGDTASELPDALDSESHDELALQVVLT